MVEWFRFTLRVNPPWRETVGRKDFLDRLLIYPADAVVPDEGGSGGPRVQLFEVTTEEFEDVDDSADAGAKSEAFGAALNERLIRAAEWLTRQPAVVFEELRAAGRTTDVFVGAWVEQDQFDLVIPPEFLRACGALGLTISICTND